MCRCVVISSHLGVFGQCNFPDDVASDVINHETRIQNYNRCFNSNNETHLEVIRTATIAQRMKPLRVKVISALNIKRKYNAIERRRFYDEYEKRFMKQKDTNLSTSQRFSQANSKYKKEIFILSPTKSLPLKSNRSLKNESQVKRLIAKYSLINSKMNNEAKPTRQYRKRSYSSTVIHSDHAAISSRCKIQRFTSLCMNTEDLKSPRLAKSIMMEKKNYIINSDGDKENNPLAYDYLSCEPGLWPSINYANDNKITVQKNYLPAEETSQIINVIDDTVGGNKSDVRRNIFVDMPELLSKDEQNESFDNELSDENGNSWSIKDEIRRYDFKLFSSPKTNNHDKDNKLSIIDEKVEIEVTEIKSHSSSPDQDPSSNEEMVTVVEKIMSNENISCTDDIVSCPDVKQNSSKFDTHESPFNELIEASETSFQKELNEGLIWRYSSPLNKHNQCEDSMTEMVNNININLTPTKSLQYLNYHLPDTDVSMKYNLDSSHMSILYSLTPALEIEDQLNKEHVNCGQECPECVLLDTSDPFNNSSPDCVPEENSSFIWDDALLNTNIHEANTKLDSNAAINSSYDPIKMDTENDTKSLDSDDQDENSSTGGSDLLELPHATVVELMESDEISFHDGMATSVNEIIAGLSERETLENSANIVNNPINIVQSVNFPIQNVVSDDSQKINQIDTINLSNVDGNMKISNFQENSLMNNVNKEQNEKNDNENVADINSNIEKSNDVSDEFSRNHKHIVIGEFIHHVIDESTSSEDTSDKFSSDSFNMKKAKECANTEIKEMETSIRDNPNDIQLLEKNSTVASEDEFNQLQNNDNTNLSDFIAKLNHIINDVGIDQLSEATVREELKNIIGSLSSDKILSDSNGDEIFQQQVHLLKQIVSESMIIPTTTEFPEQQGDHDKNIIENNEEIQINNVTIESDINESIPVQNEIANLKISDECLSQEINITPEISEVNRKNTCINILSSDNEIKTDNSNENIETPSKSIHYCVIEYQGKTGDISVQIEENSEDTLSDTVKDAVSRWEKNENEVERGWNEIRSNDPETSFIESESIDNDAIPMSKNRNNHDATGNLEVNLNLVKTSLLSLISEDVEFPDGNSEKSVEIIYEKMEIDDCDSKSSRSSVKSVSDDDSMNKTNDQTSEFFSCKDESSVNLYSCTENSSNTQTPGVWNEEEIDDADRKYITRVNSDAETYTISDCSSEVGHIAMYNSDISGNTQKSDSFSNNDCNAYDTTTNMADISSILEDDNESMINNIPSQFSQNSESKCNVCLQQVVSEYDHESEQNNINLKKICSSCLMSYSMDTRDFIRLEREVVYEGKINCESLDVSPLNPLPKYEDTTLCRVITKLSFNDSLSSHPSSESIQINI